MTTHKPPTKPPEPEPEPPTAWRAFGRELTLPGFLVVVIPILTGAVVWANKIEGEVAILKEQNIEGGRRRDSIESDIKEMKSTQREQGLSQVRQEARQSDQNELLKDIKTQIDNIRARQK